MPFYEAIAIAVASVKANKLRSVLTILGVVIGIDPAPGEDPVVGSEDQPAGSPQHQDVEVGAVIQEHDGGRRADGHVFGVEVGLVGHGGDGSGDVSESTNATSDRPRTDRLP